MGKNIRVVCECVLMICQVVSRPSWPFPVRRKTEEHWAAWKVGLDFNLGSILTTSTCIHRCLVADWSTPKTQQYLNICIHSYLVRESDRKPGSYVLSYFGKTGINHFRYNKHILDQLRDQIFIQLSSELLRCVGIITLAAGSLTVFKILLATIRI